MRNMLEQQAASCCKHNDRLRINTHAAPALTCPHQPSPALTSLQSTGLLTPVWIRLREKTSLDTENLMKLCLSLHFPP